MAEPLAGAPGANRGDPHHDQPHTQPLPRHDAEEFVRDPVGALSEPEHRHRVLLATAALTLLNTVLLVVTLANVTGGPEPVTVQGRPCLVVEVDEGNQLFCQQ